MISQDTNLFIIDDDKKMASSLKTFLKNKFGDMFTISLFSSGAKALQKVDETTTIVILDYNLGDENGNDILTSIKKINPKTEVIMLTSNDQIRIAIESFHKGASEYIIKGKTSRIKIASLILKIVMYPVRVLVKEFKISKFVAIFLLTFVGVGLVVLCVMRWMRYYD